MWNVLRVATVHPAEMGDAGMITAVVETAGILTAAIMTEEIITGHVAIINL
jgi:hypothetical protein